MATNGNAAQKIDPSPEVSAEEPSMDEILANIRKIIADDEEAQHREADRANFEHPADASNVNADDVNEVESAVVAESDVTAEPEAMFESAAAQTVTVDDAMLAELEQQVISEVAEELSAPPETVRSAEIEAPHSIELMEQPTLEDEAEAAASSADLPAEPTTAAAPVTETQPTQQADLATEPASPSEAAPEAESKAVSSSEDLQARAEQVREELGLTTAAAGNLTLEQRLERYRVRGKMRAAERAAEEAEDSETLRDAVQASIDAAPAGAAPAVSAKDVAKALLDENTSLLTGQMEEFMRPVIRQWLSENLAGLVERLVREEIERVSRGRKS